MKMRVLCKPSVNQMPIFCRTFARLAMNPFSFTDTARLMQRMHGPCLLFFQEAARRAAQPASLPRSLAFIFFKKPAPCECAAGENMLKYS
jgi:hypothetical protein